jgi:hypothetical protein
MFKINVKSKQIMPGLFEKINICLFCFSDEIGSILGKSGFKMSTVLERRSGPEFLSVLKFMRES